MRNWTTPVWTFLTSEDGPTAVEYAVMLALIIVVCIKATPENGALRQVQPDRLERPAIKANTTRRQENGFAPHIAGPPDRQMFDPLIVDRERQIAEHPDHQKVDPLLVDRQRQFRRKAEGLGVQFTTPPLQPEPEDEPLLRQLEAERQQQFRERARKLGVRFTTPPIRP